MLRTTPTPEPLNRRQFWFNATIAGHSWFTCCQREALLIRRSNSWFMPAPSFWILYLADRSIPRWYGTSWV
jgi:hypothetical protein